MQIRFQSRHGQPAVELRDVTGGHELALWSNGLVREVADDEMISFRQANGRVIRRRAIDVLFACGPDFVDAATGVNPNFACAECGVESLAEHFTKRDTLEIIHYRTVKERDADGHEQGDRLCLPCFLARNPEFIPHHEREALDGGEHVAAAKAKIAAKAGASSPAPAPQPQPVVPPPHVYDEPASQPDAAHEGAE